MYNTADMNENIARMYTKQLIERARTMPLGDLEAEVRDYERKFIELPDARGFFSALLDKALGVDSMLGDQYQVNKGILRARKREE